jgi:hypothetical protein
MKIPMEYEWIENSLLRTSIVDHRKYSIYLLLVLLAPFLVSIKKSNHDESCSIIIDWIKSCNDVMMLRPNIKYFEECVRENMQKKYPDWYCDFKSWKLF